ncbi:DUF2663 family protein [Paenibacillus sp. CGMCC 1.16610]|nr:MULTISPECIES: DUF2663 family protein [Paenibacillus]MBA2943999.1 DUF2663 family protein [Paenibacillus sp. CGMCC 1.16610]
MKQPDLNLSNDTLVLIEKLKKRKKEWDRLKKTQWIFLIVTAALLLYFTISFYHKVLLVSGGNAMVILDLLVSDKRLSASLLALISFFMFTRNLVKQKEKAKTKYENIRMETVDRLDADWLLDVKSEARDQISSYLDKEYDINIAYKS